MSGHGHFFLVLKPIVKTQPPAKSGNANFQIHRTFTLPHFFILRQQLRQDRRWNAIIPTNGTSRNDQTSALVIVHRQRLLHVRRQRDHVRVRNQGFSAIIRNRSHEKLRLPFQSSSTAVIRQLWNQATHSFRDQLLTPIFPEVKAFVAGKRKQNTKSLARPQILIRSPNAHNFCHSQARQRRVVFKLFRANS